MDLTDHVVSAEKQTNEKKKKIQFSREQAWTNSRTLGALRIALWEHWLPCFISVLNSELVTCVHYKRKRKEEEKKPCNLIWLTVIKSLFNQDPGLSTAVISCSQITNSSIYFPLMQLRNQPPTGYLSLMHLSGFWSSSSRSYLMNYVKYAFIFMVLQQVSICLFIK